MAVFLHNRFSGLPHSFSFFLFSSSSHSGHHLPRLQRSSLFWTGWPPKVSPREAPSASSRHCLYLPAPVTYTPPAHAIQLAGGCILITFMSSDIPARFITPAPADSAKTRNRPHLASRRSSRVPPFLCFPCAPLPSFFSSSGSPFVSWPAQSTLYASLPSLWQTYFDANEILNRVSNRKGDDFEEDVEKIQLHVLP